MCKAVELKPDLVVMNHMARKKVNTLSLLLILFIAQSANIAGFHYHAVDEDEKTKSESGSVVVVAGRGEYRPLMAVDNRTGGGGSRRKLAPFQLCLVCKCCVNAADPTTCANMPCCFGIDCQLPNKPYGVCAFVPKTCNCTSCPAPH